MRTIQVSEGTYAAIWSKWQEGDGSEEDIIRRYFLPGHKTSALPKELNGKGFRDDRYGVEFPEGFEIFRTYKGREYRATVKDGLWYRADINRVVASLNALSAQIGARTENAWMGWHYKDGERTRPIADLRDQSRVRRRTQ